MALWKLRVMRSTPTKGGPGGVSVLAVLAMIIGVGHLAFAYWALFSFSSFGISSWTAIGVGLVALGFTYVYVAVRLPQLEAQSWWLGMIASVISAIFGVFWLAIGGFSPSTVAFFFGLPILAVILVIVFPTSLILVRGQFGIGTMAAA